MNIIHNQSESHFSIEGDQGKLVYSREQNKLIIEHTKVSDSLKGKGAGKQLVRAAVEFSRANSLKVVPLCSFAKATIERVPEFQDVL